MGKLYDIAGRMAEGNKKPEIKIDEEHVYKINTGKSAVLYIEAISQDDKKKEMVKIDEIIKVALGEEAFSYIDSLDMPISNLSLIVTVIMAAVSDMPLEEMESDMKEEAKKPRKKSS